MIQKRVEDAHPDRLEYAAKYANAVKLSNELVRALSALKEGVIVPEEVKSLTVLRKFEVFYKDKHQRGENDSYVKIFVKAVDSLLPKMRFVGDKW